MRTIFDNPDLLKQLEEADEQDAIETVQPKFIEPNQPQVTVEQDETQPPSFQPKRYSKKSITELSREPEFNKRAERFLEGVGKNENIFEYLRDADFSLGSAMVRSFEQGNWTPEQKEDYVYLRQAFDNAEVRGVRERLGLAKDFAVDMVGDPLNILAAIFAVPTGGQSLATKTAVNKVAQEGMKKYIQAATSQEARKAATITSLEGATWGGSHDYFNQNIEVGLNIRDNVDFGQVATTTAMGATVGGLLGIPLGSKMYLDKLAKFSDEDVIIKANKEIKSVDEHVNDVQIDKDLESKKVANKIKTAAGFLNRTFVEKPTTDLARTAETLSKNEAFTKVLEVFRYDSFDTYLKKKVDKVRGKIYGEDVMIRNGKYQTALGQALQNIDRWGWWGKLSKEDEGIIISLLRNPKIKKVNGEDIKPELIKAADDIRLNVLKPIFKEGNKEGIFKSEQEVINYFPRRFNFSKVVDNQPELEKLIIQYGHADPIDVDTALKNERLFNQRAKNILVKEGQDISTIKGIDERDITTDVNVFGEDFIETAKTTLNVEEITPEVITKAKEIKAKRIVDDMIERKYQPFEMFGFKDNYSFMQSRVFSNIPDEKLALFLEDDLESVLREYITSTSQVITRAEYGMRTFADFKSNYLEPLDRELQKAGGIFKDRNNREKILNQFAKIYSSTTGVGPYAKKGQKESWVRKAGLGSEVVRLMQQTAHLGLVTVSSITEPLILLSRVPVTEAPKVFGDIGKAIGKEFGNEINIFDKNSSIRRAVERTEFKLPDGTVIKRAKANTPAARKRFDDEIYREAYQTGLALEQSILERLEGMTGEALTNNTVRQLSHGFFKATLLEQWTKAVQLASFTTGKRLIRQNSEKLYDIKRGAIKVDKNEEKYLQEQLMELGIDADEAVDWYQKSLTPEGNFSQLASRRQDFYTDKYIRGANRFTNEVILQPTAAMANKPLWFSSASGQLLMQFAGYPTVFTNTILKRFSNELFKNGSKASPRILTAALLMTGGAFAGNTFRSRGENLKDNKEWYEHVGDAIRRWGGFGAFDYVVRFRDNVKTGSPVETALLKAPFGPSVQDAVDFVQQRKGIGDVLVTNAPGYAVYDLAFGEGTKSDLRSAARTQSKKNNELVERILRIEQEESKRPRFAQGGLVKGLVDVPNVKDNPADTINKLTGETYSGKTKQDLEIEKLGLDD